MRRHVYNIIVLELKWNGCHYPQVVTVECLLRVEFLRPMSTWWRVSRCSISSWWGMVVTEWTWFRALTLMCHHFRNRFCRPWRYFEPRWRAWSHSMVQLPPWVTILAMAGALWRHLSIITFLSILQTVFFISLMLHKSAFVRISSVKCVQNVLQALDILLQGQWLWLINKWFHNHSTKPVSFDVTWDELSM